MRWLLALLACVHLAVLADDTERARIAAERQALNERFAQEERECQQRFAVTPCLEEVRSRRRAALAPLRARELQLDDAEREQRAAARRAAIEAKQRLQAARPPAASAPAPEVRVRPLPGPAPEVRTRTAPAPASAASAPTAPRRQADEARERAARAARAAERAQAAQRRREAAAADRARIERRLVEREAAGKVVAPLPVPASAPAR